MSERGQADPGGGDGPGLRPWDAFRSRDYRLLWGSNLGAVMARWVRILVTAQWLFEATGSAASLGLIGAVQLVVQIPALLWGGTLADHVDRKRLVAIASGLGGGVLLACGLLDGAGALEPWLVYAAIAVTAATQMLATPAAAALTPAVVPGRHLMLAITTDTATANAGAIAGPLLFALVADRLGLGAAFFAGAALSLPPAVLPLAIRARGRAAGAAAEVGSAVQRTWEGFRFVVRHPILPGLFLLDTGITVVSFYREILPVMAAGLFAGGAGAAGMLGAGNSAGAVVGALLALLVAGYRAKGMLVLYATLGYAVFLFGFGSAPSLALGIVWIALLGGADAVTVAVRQTTLQLTTPDHMRGRAYAFLVMAAQTANNLGTLWVGFWAAAIGAASTMLLGGALAVAATLAIWAVWEPIRSYRYP